MQITQLHETSYKGMFKLTPNSGPAFFARNEYLSSIQLESLAVDTDLSESQTDQLLDAGLACVVELKAVEYLARAEQSRFGLTRKLVQKKYEKKYIDMALDFLESVDYLSDKRFAEAWLNDRRINHFEGSGKLLSELMHRGISKDVSSKAVEDFFTENDEFEICKKACMRFQKKGKSDKKLVDALIQAGFSYKMIKEVFELNDIKISYD